MNILITGATGFIGTEFIRAFSYYNFTALSRNPAKARKLLPSNIVIIGSLAELADLDNFDAVINLAGEPIADKRWTEKQKAAICESRWKITDQLVDLIKHSNKPPKVLVSGSAIGYYGDAGSQRLSENSRSESVDFSHSLCKRWEEIALQASDHCRVVILRTGIVLGCKGGALAKMLLPFRLGLGGRIGSGRQMMSWIHQRDAVNAIEFLLKQPAAAGVFNITAPNPVSNRHFTLALASALNRKALLPIPGSVLQLLMGESASLLLASQNVYPEKLLHSGFNFEFTHLTKALANLLKT